eukprot:COSAG06_NODE_3420_length_5370_cov_22.772149_6_plen_87_part_00
MGVPYKAAWAEPLLTALWQCARCSNLPLKRCMARPTAKPRADLRAALPRCHCMPLCRHHYYHHQQQQLGQELRRLIPSLIVRIQPR